MLYNPALLSPKTPGRIAMERTLVLLKPDCVQRRLVGRLLARLEDKGLSVIAMKMMQVTPELARRHYAEHVEKKWYPNLEAFITSSPLVAAIVEGPQAIEVVRNMVGATSGLDAVPGTIRGDFACSRQMNLIHASDGQQAAAREIEIFFSPAEVYSVEPTLRPWLRAPDED
jgi:nucleoside-diphosphate kinase